MEIYKKNIYLAKISAKKTEKLENHERFFFTVIRYTYIYMYCIHVIYREEHEMDKFVKNKYLILKYTIQKCPKHSCVYDQFK